MLLSIQFPFADTRKFVENTGRLDAPAWWPSPEYGEFVRFFGVIRRRRSGVIAGWAAEERVCDFTNQLRFVGSLPLRSEADSNRSLLRCVYRRFFFDGHAVGKFEIGVASTNHTPRSLTKNETAELIRDFVKVPVKIRKPPDFTEVLPLSKAGRRLINLYAVASTTKQNAAGIAAWWTRPARPILFLELGKNVQADLPYSLTAVPLPEQLKDLKLTHCNVDYANDSFPLWILNVGATANLTDARTLRLYLLRLHAEHECLRLMLKLIGDKKLVPGPRGSETSAALQYYFTRTLRHIGRLESRAKNYDPEIAQIARQSIETVSPELAAKIADSLEDLDIRYQVLRGIKAYTEQWSQESESGSTAASTIVIHNSGEIIIGKEYNFEGAQVQAGAIGDDNEVTGNVFTQVSRPQDSHKA